MKIRMLTESAGPAGCRHAGKVYDVPEAEGKKLVAGLYAESLEKPQPAPAPALTPAPAADQDAEDEDRSVETATTPPGETAAANPAGPGERAKNKPPKRK